MKVIGNLFSILSYWIVFLTGFIFFAAFIIVGTYLGIKLEQILQESFNWVQNTADSAIGDPTLRTTVDSIIDFLNFFPGVNIADIDWSSISTGGHVDLGIDQIPGWTSWVIAAPFYFFSLLGLSIIIVNQRTTSARRQGKLAQRDVKKTNKELKTMNKMSASKLRKELDAKGIKYNKDMKKCELEKLLNK